MVLVQVIWGCLCLRFYIYKRDNLRPTFLFLHQFVAINVLVIACDVETSFGKENAFFMFFFF